MTADPRGSSGPARSMEMVAGRWVQTDLATGQQVPLAEPAGLLARAPANIRVHDYTQRGSPPSVLRWYLSRFIVCFAVQRTAGSTAFLGVFTALAAETFPQHLTFTAAVSFWGPVGQHEVEFILIRDERQQLHREVINVPYPVEEVLVERKLTASIAGPGPAFLEFHVAGQMLGRRTLYFAEMRTPPPVDEAELRKIATEVNAVLLEQQRACSDPVIEESRESKLVYFSLCQDCVVNGPELKFESEVQAVYWKAYPFRYTFMLASAFLMPRGEHRLRVDLVNAATHQMTPITTAQAVSSSSCIVTPIHGRLMVTIPSPGIYFVNAYIDDKLTGSIVVAAESDQPQYSYALHDVDIARVRAGEFLILVKNSTQSDAPDDNR